MNAAFSTPGWDLELFRLINGSPNAAFDVLMPALSASWWQWLLGGAALLAVAWRRRGDWRKLLAAGLLVALAAGLSDFSTGMLKNHFGRVRPKDALAGARYQDNGWQVRPQGFAPSKERGSSLPSAHAANSMAVAAALMLLWPRLRPWLAAFPIAVGLSRIYLGKHYPSDVLAGLLLGLAVALALGPLLARVRKWMDGKCEDAEKW